MTARLWCIAIGVRAHARLAPSVNAEMCARSLAAWRNIQSVEVRELCFDRERVACEVNCPEEICEVQPGDYWLGELISALDAGCCFGDHELLMSSYHVTYGNNVTLTRAGMTYTWDKVFHSSASEDLVNYGERSFKMARAEKGEILCVVCPSRRVGQYLIVESMQTVFENRSDAMFYELRPIEIDPTYNFVRASNWRGIPGMSGCPVFNVKGEIVSIYGLGKIESRRILSSQIIREPSDLVALTTLAPDVSVDVVPENFFKTAVADLLGTHLIGANSYFLLEAPTGSGKTMSFTVNLMKMVSPNTSVFLLPPTVAGVKAAFLRISDLLEMDRGGMNLYTVEYVIGQRHEDSTDRVEYGTKRLTIFSYGVAMRRIAEIEGTADYLLLDEIHCRSDPTVVAGDLQFTKVGMRYKCVHLTATVLTRTKSQRLAEGLDISGTKFEIKENIYIEPRVRGDDCGADWFAVPNGVVGTKLDGFHKGFKIPMQIIAKGRVIFFLSTRNDCEKLLAYAARKCGPDRQYIAIHGGTTFNIREMATDCWCFCTDVVGQAVTVPGCKVVVDRLTVCYNGK